MTSKLGKAHFDPRNPDHVSIVASDASEYARLTPPEKLAAAQAHVATLNAASTGVQLFVRTDSQGKVRISTEPDGSTK